MKHANQIVKWGKIKPFFDKLYNFNTIDIETVDNEFFLLGYTLGGTHSYHIDNFYYHFHKFLIKSIQDKRDVLTWTRYDNTHLLKLILSKAKPKDIANALMRIGKVTPIYCYEYNGFKWDIVNIIRDSMIIKNTDRNGRSVQITIYNLKNLFDTDLLSTAKNYKLDYYSKLDKTAHIIDPKKFKKDQAYHDMVIESNRLDNVILLDIADKMLEDFRAIAGNYPKTIFSNGSLARSYLLNVIDQIGARELNFKSLYGKIPSFKGLLDYSLRSYHGGKIESYILGFVPNAKVIDITSAYPYALTKLPKLTEQVILSTDVTQLAHYYYAFIRCQIIIEDSTLIHPVIVENPINKSNLSPWGTFETVITKIEYDYLIRKNVKIKVFDYYAIVHEDCYPYQPMVQRLFEERLKYKKSNPSLSQMYKIILNSLYGITMELTDQYKEKENVIEWKGYRAGDFFNPVIASYITAFTRTYLSEVSQNIIENGGELFLNMTDSVIYRGDCTLDVFSDKKILGLFEQPTTVENLYVLGAGRYEYQDEFTGKYTIKNRGFSVSVKDKSFYGSRDLNNKIVINHRTFVTSFKASTKKYQYEKMGYLIDDTYEINPFNLGGKRIIDNRNFDLRTDYTTTSPVYLEKDIL